MRIMIVSQYKYQNATTTHYTTQWLVNSDHDNKVHIYYVLRIIGHDRTYTNLILENYNPIKIGNLSNIAASEGLIILPTRNHSRDCVCHSCECQRQICVNIMYNSHACVYIPFHQRELISQKTSLFVFSCHKCKSSSWLLTCVHWQV